MAMPALQQSSRKGAAGLEQQQQMRRQQQPCSGCWQPARMPKPHCAVARLLYLVVDRPVIDRTGLQDRFDFDVEFAPEQAPTAFRPPGDPPSPPPASAEEPTAPRIYTAFEEKLGLKLESAKGPREYVVIDHVERPTRN